MLKAQMVRAAVLGLLVCVAPVLVGGTQRRAKQKPLAVCPDPTVPCKTSYKFEPHQLPFRLPTNAVIYETEWFYAVILKSVRERSNDCTVFVPEAERVEAQKLFPHHKVFASRCYDPGELYYTNVAPKQQFMAVYAGRTRAEAAQMLAQVKASGKFPGASLRRTRSGFNGT